ncbi:MAG TPA: 4Fe-4S binding protein [Hyphomicrobiaceae bacterium]|nr:4Fe-4S binding protein [Hyphomicrobiaceae bacterium]
MENRKARALLCSCENTMPLDLERVASACPGLAVSGARQLCRSELAEFRGAASADRLIVACTQEEPLFREVAGEESLGAALSFVNIRETAGWSEAAADAAPKMAALIAAAREEAEPAPFVTLTSEGVTLIYGHDETALKIAQALKETLDITVLLTATEDVVPPRTTAFPVRKGVIRTAKGHLGQFELVIDGFAEPAPSSRQAYVFGPARNGAVSRADVVIDVSGRPPLFTAPDLRPGYLRADPGNEAAIERLIRQAADLVGTFDKPRYIKFTADLCAHSRSRITGCTRCLELCPAGAIEPAGNHVSIDPYLCGGCGACSATCPTGAAQYALPSTERLMGKLRTLLTTYRAAGGKDAVLLFHDEDHGAALIDAAARFSRGLPAPVIPVAVNEVTQAGLETIAASFAYGAAHVRLLLRAKPRHDMSGLAQTVALARPVLAALGFGEGCVGTIETDDPDQLVEALNTLPPARTAAQPATFLPAGAKRELLVLALRELARVAPSPVEQVPLPARAPFGRVNVTVAGCTLCLSCVSACPTSALTAAEDRPLLRFDESLCVQCGLCQATCPEKVISLEPRLSFKAFEEGPVILKQEEPFLCISCGKPFGVRSTIERVVAKLEGKHWMFSGANAARLDLVKMCDNCRVTAVTNQGLDPYAAAERPPARTTDDYLAERERKMLEKIEKGEV